MGHSRTELTPYNVLSKTPLYRRWKSKKALQVSFRDCLRSITASGQYVPALRWLLMRGVNLRRAESLWRLAVSPESTTLNDIDLIFFNKLEKRRYCTCANRNEAELYELFRGPDMEKKRLDMDFLHEDDCDGDKNDDNPDTKEANETSEPKKGKELAVDPPEQPPTTSWCKCCPSDGNYIQPLQRKDPWTDTVQFNEAEDTVFTGKETWQEWVAKLCRENAERHRDEPCITMEEAASMTAAPKVKQESAHISFYSDSREDLPKTISMKTITKVISKTFAPTVSTSGFPRRSTMSR
ncbi:hypothetical protein R1sor_008136 [Riccia sorocarpa]|uniref:Uncharacterized protein n=1 Tax=Riccia sorocarpa TaxID=122646 RepID=A0ABD3HSH4_9MARC